MQLLRTVGDVTDDSPPRRSRNAARTREQIVAAARKVFSEQGYESATVRQIALEAGVAPNLITRYFGGKAGLFQAAGNIDLGVVAAVEGPFESLGARIAETVLARYETGPTADPLQMLARSAGTPNGAGLGGYFADQAARPLVGALAAHCDGDRQRAADRVAAAGALILGVIMSRYVLHEGPLAHTDEASLQHWLTHGLQRIFDDPETPSLHHSGGWTSPKPSALD
jgi:AcrR family transcriptional regulator